MRCGSMCMEKAMTSRTVTTILRSKSLSQSVNKCPEWFNIQFCVHIYLGHLHAAYPCIALIKVHHIKFNHLLLQITFWTKFNLNRYFARMDGIFAAFDLNFNSKQKPTDCRSRCASSAKSSGFGQQHFLSSKYRPHRPIIEYWTYVMALRLRWFDTMRARAYAVYGNI